MGQEQRQEWINGTHGSYRNLRLGVSDQDLDETFEDGDVTCKHVVELEKHLGAVYKNGACEHGNKVLKFCTPEPGISIFVRLFWPVWGLQYYWKQSE